MMAASTAQIKRELTIITKTPVYGVYVSGIAEFLAQWRRKTPEEKQRLCRQIQQVTERSRAMALEIFGSRGVLFFERLNVEAVDWGD